MNQYWAQFCETNTRSYRLDTRVYLQPIDKPKRTDDCVGAIIGKNPGSAQPSKACAGLTGMSLGYDQFLRAVRDIPTKAYTLAGVKLPERGYIQVLNLFYLCDPNLPTAIKSLQLDSDPIFCETENKGFPWVWYAWGGNSPQLNPLKERFAGIRSEHHFYYDLALHAVVVGKPPLSATAKHTQGLPRQPVIDHFIKQLLPRCCDISSL